LDEEVHATGLFGICYSIGEHEANEPMLILNLFENHSRNFKIAITRLLRIPAR